MAQQEQPSMQGEGFVLGPNQRTVCCSLCNCKFITTAVKNKSRDGDNFCLGMMCCLFGFIPCALYLWFCDDEDSEKLTHSCPSCGSRFQEA